MIDMDDDSRKEALGEVLFEELKAIREYVKDVPAIKQKVSEVDERLINVESDVKVVKAAVTDLSREQHEHDRRLSQLESAA